ncbi:MAG: heme biosynthesis HemY N-terminal domain-containing protein [Pseudomonadota bacterium]
MLRFFFFLLVVLALGLLFAWVADNPGTLFLKWDWLAEQLGRPGEEVGIPLTLAIALLIGLMSLIMLVTGFLRGMFSMPSLLSKFFENRRREKGFRALSQGLIAASSGDVDSARQFSKESSKLLKNEPLVALLGTQTAILEGNRDAARQNFQAMLEDDNTRMVALRGLFLEAERQGEPEAARHYAEEAVKGAPSLPWAGNAKLRYQAVDKDWDAAIQTLEANRAAGLIERDKAKRHRAVLLTAKAISEEQAHPEAARKHAKEAHKLAKDFVPAATAYARSASRLGDIRSGAKILEATWKLSSHPEIADAYMHIRSGDSVIDRLKRAKKLAGLRANNSEGNLAVAVAAIDAKDWDEARSALEPVLTTRPTERACLLMADIEEGQHGDQGRMRDWLSRAVRAPADEAWTADGHVSEEWLPLSPVTGEIDAFEWKVPVAQLGEETVPVLTLEQLHEEAKAPVSPIAIAAATAGAGAAANSMTEEEEVVPEAGLAEAPKEADVVEAVVISDAGSEAKKADDKPTDTNSEESMQERTEMKDSSETSSKDSDDKEPDADASDVKSLPNSANDNMESALASDSADENTSDVSKGDEAETEDGKDAVVSAATGMIATQQGEAKSDDDKTDSFRDNQVQFPLDRRPDDPGPHPDKEPPKKGFKLF